jgi:uncharacterized RDD family membrane protein YckC
MTDVVETKAPSLRRRMACFLYEGVLLFGVVMIATWLFSTLSQQRHALQSRHLLQGFLFVVFGIYFAWFWSRSGQTLAMKTWHLRLITRDGAPVSQGRALARYFLSWIWFLPSLAVVALLGQTHSQPAIWGALTLGVVVYALSSKLQPQRQFWHDALCGTRLVDSRVAR